VRARNAETALFAGLMVDIGQLYLIARVGSYPAIVADFRGFSELVGFWNAALRRSILESMALPGELLEALELDQPYAGAWPPAALEEILFFAGLAAESENPFDPQKGEARLKLLESAHLEFDTPRLEDLLDAARGEREDLLSVLTG
jgi:hypothetical protein